MKMFRTSARCGGNWKVGRQGRHGDSGGEDDSKNSI